MNPNPNYNITLLKTIKEPLLQSFSSLEKELSEVLSMQREAKDISIENISNIVGNLQMVGRQSLVRVSKDVKNAVEKLKVSEENGWDRSQVVAVAKLSAIAISHLHEHLHALLRGESEMAVRLWPSWSKMQVMLGHPEPDPELLFDPDPVFKEEKFSSLSIDELRQQSEKHLASYDDVLSEMEKLAKDEGVESNKKWGVLLNSLDDVFSWALNLKHRMGYHAYWVTCRARVAMELIEFENLKDNEVPSTKNKTDLIDAMRSAQIELNKFVEDSRKPRHNSLIFIAHPLLYSWSEEWNDNAILKQFNDMFGLDDFWQLISDLKDNKNQKSEIAFISKQDELFDSIQNIKNIWTKISASKQVDPRPFLRSLMVFLPKYELFPNPGVKPLMESLKVVAQKFVNEKQTTIDQDLAQEVATALLLIEETIQKKGRWSQELEQQAELTKKRVTAIAMEDMAALQSLPMVSWGSDRRRQQSQEAVSKVVVEVLKDVSYIESVFDEFFRGDEQEARLEQNELKNKISVCSSVLKTLGQNNASAVMDTVHQISNILGKEDIKPENFKKEYKTLTISLTGISSFLNSFEKGDPDAMRLLEPSLQHLGLQERKDKSFEDFSGSAFFSPSTKPSVIQTENVEMDEATHAFDNNLGIEDKVVDEEITEAFFEETVLVLSNIDTLRKNLIEDSENQELLADLRRQFHTLKGGARISLLWGLGEFAKRIEDRFNHMLSREEGYSHEVDILAEYGYGITEMALQGLTQQNKFNITPEIISGLNDALSISLPDNQSESEIEDIEEKDLADENENLDVEELDFEGVKFEKQEAERLEAERIEEEKQEAERLEAEKQEAERLEAELLEAERLEFEKQEAERLEAERLEFEKQEAERLEAERLEAERIELEKQEAERIEAERLEFEKQEAERIEAERQEAERLEFEKQEAERIEAERLEFEKQEAERLEAERQEAERLEFEKQEADRIEAERQEAERLEFEKQEADRIEAERQEAERLEFEKQEAERLEAERLELEKQEAERLEAERLEAERLDKENENQESDVDNVVINLALDSNIDVDGVTLSPNADSLDISELEFEGLDEDKQEDDEVRLINGTPALDIISDLKVHLNNLASLKNSSNPDISLIHWSSHTVSSLARVLGEQELSSFAKNLENKLDVSKLDDISEVSLSEEETQSLSIFIDVLYEKVNRLINTNLQESISWGFKEKEAETRLDSFEISLSKYKQGDFIKDMLLVELEDDNNSPSVSTSVKDSDEDESMLLEKIGSKMSSIAKDMEEIGEMFEKLSQKLNK